MPLLSFNDLKALVLTRGDENSDGTSPWDTLIASFAIEAQRQLLIEHQFLGLLAYPPQAQVVPAAITALTITTTAGSQAAVLSAVPTGVGGGNISVNGWWVLIFSSPSGQSYFMRVTAHVAGSPNLTLDAVPETMAGHACVLAMMDLSLVAGTGVLADKIWTFGGGFDTTGIDLYSVEELQDEYPGLPTQSWPPSMAARIGMTTVRLSHYDILPHRVEIPYMQELIDPTGAAPLGIPQYLIPALCEKTLSFLYEGKGDSRLSIAEGRYTVWLDRAKHYESLLRTGLGTGGQQRRNEPFGEGSGRGADYA